jgi:four helix bundle suffix protein
LRRNTALVLIGVACALLDRQILSQAEAFVEEGGFTERLYRVRNCQEASCPSIESTVEDAALTWFGELGYAVGHGPHLAPVNRRRERKSFGEVVLAGRLARAIRGD